MTHSLVRHNIIKLFIPDGSPWHALLCEMITTECQRESAFGLQQFQYNNPQVLRKVKGHLEETNFTGITVLLCISQLIGVFDKINFVMCIMHASRGELHLILMASAK